jgi:hypothetical protein
MVGGKVIETITLEDRVWVNVKDTHPPQKNTCAVYIERNINSEQIAVGDSLWWQSDKAFWTPAANSAEACNHREHITCEQKCGVDYDIAIPRLSYSGVNRPEGHDVLEQDLIYAD